MVDSHGQIWMQVVEALKYDPELLSGTVADSQQRVIQALKLGSDIQFPIRRLVTIGKNEKWMKMVSRWCETTLGRATFKISTWEWMISYRIDEVSRNRHAASPPLDR